MKHKGKGLLELKADGTIAFRPYKFPEALGSDLATAYQHDLNDLFGGQIPRDPSEHAPRSAHHGFSPTSPPNIVTVLILYSYRVHGVLATYLREQLEAAVAQAAEVSKDLEWETHYKENAVPGIRKRFFLVALWAVTMLSPLVLLLTDDFSDGFAGVFGLITAAYLAAAAWLTFHF